jgi:cyclophilin family peptidyl-prolyl cis-trans isomerase
VFGRVISGEETVDLIENLNVDEKSKPTSEVILSHCGELVIKKS